MKKLTVIVFTIILAFSAVAFAGTDTRPQITPQSPEGQWLTKLYSQYLGRTCDGSVLQELGPRAATPAGRRQIAHDLINGQDFHRGAINRLYQSLLNRPASPAEAASLNFTRSRQELLGSDEYFRKAGGTNAGYLAHLYEDVLAHQMPRGTESSLIGLLRPQMLNSVLSHQDAMLLPAVQKAFGMFFPTDQRQLNFLADQLRSGKSFEDAAVELALSPEF